MTKQISISDETYEKIKDQLQEAEKFNIDELKDFIGKQVFNRTVNSCSGSRSSQKKA